MKEYIVLNKEKLPKGSLKRDAVTISGKSYKVGDVIKLEEKANDTIYLLGQGWIELKNKKKATVLLDGENSPAENESKKQSSGQRQGK